MYLSWSFCTLYLLTCQVTVTVGDSNLCRCVACYMCDVYQAILIVPLLIIHKHSRPHSVSNGEFLHLFFFPYLSCIFDSHEKCESV